MNARSRDAGALIAGVAAVGVVTLIYASWLRVANPATVSTTYLMIVLLVATNSRLWVSVATSIVAVLFFNFFFLPPVGTFTIADPQNWVSLFAFLAVSLVASKLSDAVRSREHEAIARRDELGRLFDLSRDVLMVTDSAEALSMLARSISRRFDLDYVAVAVPRGADWDIVSGGSAGLMLDKVQLSNALASAKVSLEFDAYARTYSGHRTTAIDGREVHLVPLRSGTRPIGLLAAAGRPVESGTLDALAGIAAIAIERAQFLDERKAAELTKQSEQLKAALLASLGHDLRTPLTAIRIAATNVKDMLLAPEQREAQADLILSEGERLSRLFQNILEMARIDAGAVAAETRWAHPSEILAGARDQVAETLRNHTVSVTVADDVPVQVDPRLTAAAVAQVLENAAQYSPAARGIEVSATVEDAGLTVRIRDHGPGIAPGDLPHLFERFYRGDAARVRASGTGIGLWIARGLLAVQRGRIWADNCADGGAQFTIAIPAQTRPAQSVPEPA